MKKKLQKAITLVFGVLVVIIVGLMILGYFISRNELKNPREHYTAIGKRVYTAAPTMIIDANFDLQNLSGHGVKIGVLDAGFGGLREYRWTKHLHVAAYANFVSGDTVGFFTSVNKWEIDHGAYSCACIGGRLDGDTLKGLAWNAEYYLAHVDDPDAEPRSEEKYKMEAILWLLSHNVDIITSSVGHTVFDDFNGYTPQMLDGHSSLLSHFVDSILVANPRLIFVQSIGNEGDKPWYYNTFPADVHGVIAVGAVERDSVTRASYSSFGWKEADYVKPDVCAYVQPPRRGTSFTTPVITGLCATLLEYKQMDREELIRLLHASGLNASTPNCEVGYGVPQTSRMPLLL